MTLAQRAFFGRIANDPIDGQQPADVQARATRDSAGELEVDGQLPAAGVDDRVGHQDVAVLEPVVEPAGESGRDDPPRVDVRG